MSEIKLEIDNLLMDADIVRVRKNKKTVEYYNLPCAFDIETTSIINNEGEKNAFMYVWQICLNHIIIMGRTWDEFKDVIELFQTKFLLNDKKRLVIYVHNLAYEFQFMRKHFKWDSIFALEERKVANAITGGIEFRCSYILSGYSLSKVAEHLQTYKIKKLVGDLDYSKVRNSLTTLTEEEIHYCINDVLIIVCYIQEKLENESDIAHIPMTKTGYVRRLCKNACLPSKTKEKEQFIKYSKLMKCLQLEPSEYEQLKRAYQGGFTHANAYYVGKVLNNVASFDFASSYPSVMIACKFPMSRGRDVYIDSVKKLNYYLENYCCLFDIEINNIVANNINENILSLSKCYEVEDKIVNNGRIVQATHLITTMTEQDFFSLREFYSFDSFKVFNFKVYKKDYLPKELITTILDLYAKKTTLKGVEGQEIEYMSAKENINSTYGMMVTDIVREEIEYNEDLWSKAPPELNDAINIYNKSKSRFLSYAWGVWVTAYARRNLMGGILEFDTDYIYSDTDSIKCLNYEKHMKYINNYNKEITDKIYQCLDYYKLPHKLAHPLTINGKSKPLGVWDFEGVYDKFKTLGAKRYMIFQNNTYNITVSGLNKGVCVPYLINQANLKSCTPFDLFDNEMYIPSDYTGKKIHTYLDFEQDGLVKDYQGNIAEYHELSSVHLSNSDFSLSLADAFIDYLLGIEDKKSTI